MGYDINNINFFDFPEFRNLSEELRRGIKTKYESDGMYNYNTTYVSAVMVVNYIKEHSDVVFVTASNIEHSVKRINQMQSIFPWCLPTDIIFTPHKHLILGDIIIDDNVTNIYNSACKTKLMYTQVWNAHIPVNRYKNIKRVSSWLEILNEFKLILKERGQ